MNYHLFALWILLSTSASGLRLSNFASRIAQLESTNETQMTKDQGPTLQERTPFQSCYTGHQHAKLHELQRMKCPTCKKSHRPKSVEIVMPFFQNDLSFTKLTAQSIVKHDKSHFISKVNLVWVSPEDPGKFLKEINAIEAVLHPTHYVQTHRFPIKHSGWHAQQMAKLDMASRVNTKYAMILDVKNTFVRDFSSEDFFDNCGLAKHNLNVATGPERWGESHPEGKWWSNAVEYLSPQSQGEDESLKKERLQTFIENEVVPFTVTPQLFHRETVNRLLSCDQEVSENTIYNLQTTEFMLYHAFQSLRLRGLIKGGKCVNSPESKNGQVFIVWREDDCSTLEKYLKQEQDMPMFVGFHPGALKDVAQDKSTQCWSTLTQIYKQSGLEIDDKEWENQRRASECRGCEQTQTAAQ